MSTENKWSITMENAIPEFGDTFEPVFQNDDHDTMREKLRMFVTAVINHHETSGGHDRIDTDTIPCMSILLPCFLSDDSAEAHVAATAQSIKMLAVFQEECERLDYHVLSTTPTMFSTKERKVANATDRANGWVTELTHKKFADEMMQDTDNKSISLTRLWLELSIKTHGPSYIRAMKQMESEKETQDHIQRIMQQARGNH